MSAPDTPGTNRPPPEPAATPPAATPAAAEHDPSAEEQDRRLLRALDTVWYGLLALGGVCAVPALRSNVLGDIGYAVLVPCGVVTIGALRLPADLPGCPRWPVRSGRLRLAGLSGLGLAPFLVWWSRVPASPYLTVCAVLALLAAVWFFTELAGLMQAVAHAAGDPHLTRRAAWARTFLLFGSLAPMLAVMAALAGYVALAADLTLESVEHLWALVPLVLRVLMVMPAVEAGLVLTHVRRLLERCPPSRWDTAGLPGTVPPTTEPRKVPCPCRAPPS